MKSTQVEERKILIFTGSSLTLDDVFLFRFLIANADEMNTCVDVNEVKTISLQHTFLEGIKITLLECK